MANTFDAATDVEDFNETLDNLTRDLFYESMDVSKTVEISQKSLRKSAWISSILSNSSEDDHKEKALAFSVLAFAHKSGTEQEELFQRYLYLQLSRLGNLPSFLSVMDDTNIDFGEWEEGGSTSILMDELTQSRRHYQIGEESFLSKFQLDIWNNLDERHLVISGPTSSGKSHVIQEYLQRSIDDKFQCVYIVPNRALISEASGKFRRKLEDIEILTGAYLDEIDKDRFILVLTPERCLTLFDYSDDEDINLDLIFIDEIQNLESSSRGPLFENILEGLREYWPNSKIIGAGPYISNPEEIFEQIFDVKPKGVESEYTPAHHLVQSLILKNGADRIDAYIESPSGETLREKINRPTGLTYTGIANRRSNAVAKAVNEFGGESQNLVYANTKLRAENWASEIASQRSTVIDHPEINELTSFLSDAVHGDYSLVSSLEKGVAFHHGGVPKVAREEIERLYDEEIIDTVVSTSTLLEGVNLPAEKLFIFEAKVSKYELSDFDYQNLIGRVGRVSSKLYGSVILVAAEDDDWTERRREGGGRKDVVPVTNKVFQDMTSELMTHIDDTDIRNMPNRSLQYTIAILRNKFQKDDHDLIRYLERKGMESDTIREIDFRLGEVMDDISVPSNILRGNPTVDPILQDRLYTLVTSDPQAWEINAHRLQNDFFNVTRRLNSIFWFVNDSHEGIFLDEDMEAETEETQLIRILYPAYFWLRGDSYRKIILNRYQNVGMEQSIDATIKKVLSIINTDVRFVLVKYYKILCDILKEDNDYDNKFMMNFDKRLERGAFQSNTLQLMDLGVDRSIAINLDPPDENLEDYLKEIADDQSNMVQVHLDSLGLLD